MNTVIHAVIGYFYLLLILRVLVRRPGAQISASEFVLVFLIGGVVILATMGDDRSVTNALAAVVTIGLCHEAVSVLKQRFPWLGLIIDGAPLVLMKDGQWQFEAMRRTHISDADVMSAARKKGVKTLDRVKYAILERNGGISIIERKD